MNPSNNAPDKICAGYSFCGPAIEGGSPKAPSPRALVNDHVDLAAVARAGAVEGEDQVFAGHDPELGLEPPMEDHPRRAGRPDGQLVVPPGWRMVPAVPLLPPPAT